MVLIWRAFGSGISSADTSTGPRGQKGVKALGSAPLSASPFALPVTGTDVVSAGVAGYEVKRVLLVGVFAVLAEDHGKLAFVIGLVGFKDAGQPDWTARVLDGRNVFVEDDWILGDGRVRFRGVAAIVLADADDLDRLNWGEDLGDLGWFTRRREARKLTLGDIDDAVSFNAEPYLLSG